MLRSVLTRFGISAVVTAGLVLSICAEAQAASVGSSPQAVSVARPSLRIVAFGSSSTEGIGATSPAASYPAQLQAILARSMPRGEAVEVVNKGIGGQDVDDMMKRLDADVITAKPDIVIWQTGSNDPMRHVPIERFEAETRAGVRAMQQAGLRVIFMEPQWCPRLDATGDVDLFRDAIRRIADEFHVAIIRRGDLMRRWVNEGRMTKSQMLANDGLHMSDRGYARSLPRSSRPGWCTPPCSRLPDTDSQHRRRPRLLHNAPCNLCPVFELI